MLQLIILFITVVLSTSYTLRMYFEGYLVGDPLDTRLLISQHDHWFKFFSNKTDFRDTLFFYPYDAALGFTDASFLSALPYSIFRTFELHPTTSWFISIFLFLLVGNLGWAFVAHKIFSSKTIQVFFVWSISNFPTFVILLERAPQIIAFSWISWLFYLTLLSVEKFRKHKTNYPLGILIVLLPLVMLTSWYPAFFYLISSFTALLIFVLLNSRRIVTNLKTSRLFFNKEILKPLIVALPASITLLVAWLYIYLPLLGVVTRSWDETIYYSSYLSQIINQKYLNNGWYYIIIKDSQYHPFEQSNIGLPALVLMLGLLFLLTSFFVKSSRISNYRNYLLIPTLVLFLVFLRITEEFSIFKLFWERLPGLESIRFPYRYLIIFGFALIIFIFVNFDQLLIKNESSKIAKFIILGLTLMLSLDNLKPVYAIWTKSDYLKSTLESKSTEIKKSCDFFILDSPGGWWDDQINAMSISVLTGIPTANGYSGGFPRNYPAKPWNYEGEISSILQWAQFGVSNSRGCLVSNSHEIIYSDPQVSNIYFHSGFSPSESDGKGNSWRWAESNQGYVILSIPKNQKNFQFQFSVKTAECLDQTKLKIYEEPDKLIFEGYITKKNQEYILNFENNLTTINQLRFMSEGKYCNFEGDPRNLYFEIKNFKIKPT